MIRKAKFSKNPSLTQKIEEFMLIPTISKGMDKIKSLLSVDIYESGVKDNRKCALPAHYCKTKKDVFFGRKVLAKRIKTNPLPLINFPKFDNRQFELDNRRQIENENRQMILNLIQALEDCSLNVQKLLISYRIIPCNNNRILPGGSEFINKEFNLNNSVLDRLKILCNSVGLSNNLYRLPYHVPDLIAYTRKGKGFLGVVNERYDKVLVEVLTFISGKYSRYILLVSLGFSCTVWYMSAPGDVDHSQPVEIFQRILRHSKFLNPNHDYDQFKKICFIEHKYITGEVLSALENVFPFSEMDIPVINNVDIAESSNQRHNLKVAVGFGLMVAVFLTLGIIPPSTIKEEL